MGRGLKPYTKECEKVREMGPGQTEIFKPKKLWGLVNRLYEMMDDWNIKEYYRITIKGKEGIVIVYRHPQINLLGPEDFDAQGNLL